MRLAISVSSTLPHRYPQEISVQNLKNEKLRYSASEMMWLIKYLSILISDWIPEHNIYLELFVLMKKVYAILFLETIDSTQIELLNLYTIMTSI